MNRPFSAPTSRLQLFVALAILLAGAACVMNYRYWRGSAQRQSASPAPSSAMALPQPVDDRPQRIVALAQHLQRNPEDRAARFQLADLYFQMRDYPRSLAELRILEREQPRDHVLLVRQAVVLKQDGRPREAEKLLQRALAIKPDYALAREGLGQARLDQGRYRDALEAFNQCLKSQPNSLSALFGKSRALEGLFLARNPIRRSDMIAPVEKVVRLAPDNPEGLATLARLKFAYEQSDGTEAERLALRATQLDPRNPQPYVTLAQIYLVRPPTPENLEKIAGYAYVAGQLDPRDPRPAYLVGRVALAHNDLERAIKAMELSLRLEPLPEVAPQLAVAYRRSGNAERAGYYSEAYQRYMDLLGRRDGLLAEREREPRQVRHYYALAELYLEALRPDTAEQWLKRAEGVRLRDPERDRLLARVRALRKKGFHAPLLPLP